MPFPVLLSTLIRSRFQAKPATLLIPIDFPFLFAVEELYGTRYQSVSFTLIYVGHRQMNSCTGKCTAAQAAAQAAARLPKHAHARPPKQPHRQMNSRPSPRGQSANDQQNTNYNNDISYCAVQPLDPENRATSLWDYKKVWVAGTFNDPSDAFKYMYQYHLQAA